MKTQELEYITQAELKKLEARKTISNDVEIMVTLVSHDTRLLDLGKFPADTCFDVSITPSTGCP